MSTTSPSLLLVHKLLLSWFKSHGRTLPWRSLTPKPYTLAPFSLRDPYRILVSELMLQQTQVSRVIPKFEAFIKKWPTIRDLANASLSDVLIEWKGLGYNRRAKFMLETAKIVTHTYNGIFPQGEKELRALPGFGDYMVSAIRVFAFNKQDTVIDVNVSRVNRRVFAGLESLSTKEVKELSDQVVPKGDSDAWHQALMDFGATICTAKNPFCSTCPLSRICTANTEAKKLGYTDYSAWLLVQPKMKRSSPKDAGKTFEQTDRYFRGRIIDYLRDGEQTMENLRHYILVTKELGDITRFARIIEQLVIDGLIKINRTTVSLG